jgi:LAGLIDADG endonuclease
MKLNPWFITGLVEGEGCFSISFTLRKRLTIGIETRPSFSISLNRRDLELIKVVQDFFQCGAIRFSRNDNTYKYEVRSIRELMNKIIPHFAKYPLVGHKRKDFSLFDIICTDVYKNLHLNKERLKVLIKLAYQMNVSGKRKHIQADLLRMLDK